jgi:D-alanyl-lipoteichoic acid acyltransferase DltB (MBOAT superfamily)
MTFNSWPFLVFLPLTFAVYWSLKDRLRWQNLFLVLASYVFYGWWDWRFLILIVITSLSSFFCARLMECCTQRSRQRWLLTANVTLNIGILGCFKYFNFFAGSLQAVAAAAGLHLDMPTVHLILPVGISFYTFQSLSYTIDVYREKLKATHDVLAFLAYISFFPQLVAGPIERATDLLPQMLRCRRFCVGEAVDGLRQMLWGFFKKMVVADTCALAVNQIWDNWQEGDALLLVVGMVLFSFQIYGDFSGYSDIAIGTGRLFGVRLSDNFRLPYLSRSMAEFWRRWHISLMGWFRDYVYIPLGGSRVSRLVTVRNILVVFALSGLWHGASWTYVAWGLYNAILLALPLLVCPSRKRESSEEPTLSDFPRILMTFTLAAVGWVIFRSSSLAEGLGFLSRMLTQLLHGETGGLSMGKWALVLCASLMAAEWLQRDKRHVLQFPSTGLFRYRTVRWMVYYVLLLLIILMHGEEQTFIYFQF